MQTSKHRMWVGALISSKDLDTLNILTRAALVIDEKGIIMDIEEIDNNKQVDLLKQKYNLQEEMISFLGDGEFLSPGFIDCHTHAPQYPNVGVGLDMPLLEWLETYTFPTEKSMLDSKIAFEVYSSFVDKLIRNGTTTVCYFATLHLEATKILADIVHEKGQRAWVGKVNMDCYTPDYLSETTEESLKSTEEFIKYLKNDPFSEKNLVEPCVTPRFALTCSSSLLKGLGELVSKYNVPVQSHLCESIPEIELALKRHPGYANYTEIYRQNGLMTNRTIMAHCIHLKKEEREAILTTGAGIAHCASSNFNLSSGVLDIRPLFEDKIKVGLGTDVSGGSSPSMLHAIQSSFLAAKVTQMSKSLPECPLNIERAFYLATLGGACAMGLDKAVGNFQVGKQFDALLVNTRCSPNFHFDSEIPIPKEKALKILLSRFLQAGDENWISKVFVQGRQIHSLEKVCS